jgi:hypothetical protein
MRTAGQISRINKTKWGVGGDPRCDALRQHANIQTLLHKPVPQIFGVMALLRLAFVADSTCQPSCQMGPGGYPERWGEGGGANQERGRGRWARDCSLGGGGRRRAHHSCILLYLLQKPCT